MYRNSNIYKSNSAYGRSEIIVTFLPYVNINEMGASGSILTSEIIHYFLGPVNRET